MCRLAAFLSGGIDSSAVVALMRRYTTGKVKTFSLGFSIGGKYNELADARRVAQHLDTEHHELVFGSRRPRSIRCARSSITTTSLLVTRRRFPSTGSAASRVSKLPSCPDRGRRGRAVWRISSLRAGPTPVGLQTPAPRVESNGDTDNAAGTFQSCAIWPVSPEHWQSPIRPSAMRPGSPMPHPSYSGELLPPRHRSRRSTVTIPPGLPALLLEAQRHHCRGPRESPDVRRSQDLTGATAIWRRRTRPRWPVASKHACRSWIIGSCELAFQIPGRFKIRGRSTKRVLKRALRPLLPAEILDKPKQGFSVPINHWFRGKLKAFAFEVLLDSRARAAGLLQHRHGGAHLARARRRSLMAQTTSGCC